MIQDIVAKVHGDIEIVTRVFRAMSGGTLDTDKISADANRVCHDFRNGVHGDAIYTDDQREGAAACWGYQ